MRVLLVALALCVAAVTTPAAVRAACPGFAAAEAVRDAAVDAKYHSSKLTDGAAAAALAHLDRGIADAKTCTAKGSVKDRAANLAVLAQLRWNRACVLSYDGKKTDGAAAVALAKLSDREMNAFESANPDLDQDGRLLFDNWQHFDGDMVSGTLVLAFEHRVRQWNSSSKIS